VAESWRTRIARAEQLAAARDPAAPLVAFYAAILAIQARVHEAIRSRAIGSFDADVGPLAAQMPDLLRTVAASGPPPLADDARALAGAPPDQIEQMLRDYHREPSGTQFFAKALLQPYLESRFVTGSGVVTKTTPDPVTNGRCPRCGGAPQVSVLLPGGDSADGGVRQLQCAVCLHYWPFRRVVCAACGEEDERKLAYFHTPALDHLRVEACDTCRRYVKGVDRTRLGLAVPLVDEVAGAALDVWAREHGYEKIELNLVGV